MIYTSFGEYEGAELKASYRNKRNKNKNSGVSAQ